MKALGWRLLFLFAGYSALHATFGPGNSAIIVSSLAIGGLPYVFWPLERKHS